MVQVLEHNRSRRGCQYALAERAVALGWARSQVTVIDDDLGVSAAVADSRYTDLGAGYHQARLDTDRKIRNHIRQLQALGFEVTITKAA